MFLSAEPSYRSHPVVCILIVDLLLIWLSFGTLVSFFFFFVVFDTNNFFYCVCKLRNIRQGERWKSATKEKGLNDTQIRRLAPGDFFFFFLFIFMFYCMQLLIYKMRDGKRRQRERA